MRKTLLWIGGIFLFILVGCGLIFALGIGMDGFETPVQGDAVALVRVEGTILSGSGDNANPFTNTGGAFSTTIIDQLKKADESEQVKAVVLVVDTPGGSVYASDEIALQVGEMSKPILSAMGSIAASGGYYVSAPTDEIWASPHTLTCSIGVIIQLLNYDDLAAEYGVDSIVYKSGTFKDMGNPFEDATEAEEAIWRSMIDEAYDAFVAIVAEGRGLKDGTVREFADGRICTGKQAMELNLVDNLGYLPDVIKRAGELGGIEGDPPTIEYNQEPSFLELLTSFSHRPSLIGEIKELLQLQSGPMLMYLYSGR
ncbi:MAG: signal peptide peptidase SppA [Chloroflexota bacterium]